MNECINILCATDAAYVPYCAVMLTSVFECNKNERINVYVLIDKPLPAKAKKRFMRLAEQYNNGISFLHIDKSFVQDVPVNGMDYWSVATYYRLYAAELLPDTVHRILYLDCDVVVNGSLRELYQTDLTDKALAAADDIYIYTDARQNNLGYPPAAGYFNAGVLLINVDYWRRNQVGKQCLSFLAAHHDSLEANDQDVLNAVLWNVRVPLPLACNYQIQFLSKHFFALQSEEKKREILDAYSRPLVIHYAYYIKPWAILYYKKPFLSEWQHYQRLSPWRHVLPSLPKRKTINYIIKRYLLWPLGWMHYDSGFIV